MNIFESIRHINEYDAEYWSARELWQVLEYGEYRNFIPVIEKAKTACRNSSQPVEDHFVEVHEMVDIGSGAKREIDNYYLSRYACYLIVQNSDPSKTIVALGQTYFAIQTRKQEVQELALEDSKRVMLREEMKKHNRNLAEAADSAGVVNYAAFQDYGYMGLYGGMRNKDIHKKKGLSKSQKILDHMGSEELAANLFRATQTEAKLRRENIQGEAKANKTHHEVGKKVRETINDLGGTMPEELPPADGIGKAQTRLKQVDKKKLTPKSDD